MRNKFMILVCSALSNLCLGQTTLIPDSHFEQELINQNIDSDQTLNGHVLTSDIASLAEVVIDGSMSSNALSIEDMTGIENFISLEKLRVNFTSLSTLNLSQNSMLTELDCSSNLLSAINVFANLQLQKLSCGNYGIDVGQFNAIDVIDLSQNPAINYVNAYDMDTLKKLNLKNGNNTSQMIIDVSLFPYGVDQPDYNPSEIRNSVCIEIDDEMLAQENQFPYSQWQINAGTHVAINLVEDCSLGIDEMNL